MGNLQIKDIDAVLHERLRDRAAAEGRSMRDHVLLLIERDLALPSVTDWLDEVASLPSSLVSVDTAALVRADREERTDAVLAAEESGPYADGA